MIAEEIEIIATAIIEEEQKKLNNPVTSKLGEVSQGIGQVIPGMVAGTVNPYLGGVAFMTSAAGSYYDDAVNREMSHKQALQYSTS